jgi:calcineurin-like phosphoesterase family protein
LGGLRFRSYPEYAGEMTTTYIISDTHLNHDKIKTYCVRPDNFTELIDKNVKSTLKPKDILIHVGDLGIGPHDGYMSIVQGWKALGIKLWLILGNHDNKGPQWYVDHGFDWAGDAMMYRGAWFTHKPSPFLPVGGCHVNVHGHLHNVWDGFVNHDPEKAKDEFYNAYVTGHLPYSWNRLFSVEYTNYMPIAMDKFIQKPDKYQARGPNEETRLKRKARFELEAANVKL